MAQYLLRIHYMNYRGVRAFCSAAKHMSFKVAAEELSVTASAISHQIKNLESYLGCKLFSRGTRAIELTLDGQRLYAELQKPVAEVESAVLRFRSSPDRVPLRIEMPAFFASEIFLPRIPEFSAGNRHIDLRVQTTLPNEAQRRIADLHIMLSGERPQTACSEKLFPLHYQPACSPDQHRYWCNKGPEDLQHATLIVHEARPHAWQSWFADRKVNMRAPQQTITVDSMYGLARATQRGAGIALIPVPVSQQWFDSGQLVPLFDYCLPGKECYWLTSDEPLEEFPARRMLWDWAVSNFTLRQQPTGEKA